MYTNLLLGFEVDQGLIPDIAIFLRLRATFRGAGALAALAVCIRPLGGGTTLLGRTLSLRNVGLGDIGFRRASRAAAEAATSEDEALSLSGGRWPLSLLASRHRWRRGFEVLLVDWSRRRRCTIIERAVDGLRRRLGWTGLHDTSRRGDRCGWSQSLILMKKSGGGDTRLHAPSNIGRCSPCRDY
jgi:hypothetical protein